MVMPTNRTPTLPHSIKRYGWTPDLPDKRDHVYRVAKPAALPAAVDLRPLCPPVYDQGQLGSCTANGIAGALEFDQMKEKLTPVFVPSRLFIYYNERVIEGSVSSDSGAMIRDGIKTVAHAGAPPESDWPYLIRMFKVKPNLRAYQNGLKHPAIAYQSLAQSLDPMKTCLASGYPFVFGFSVYDSFESQVVATTGVAPMPGPQEALLGGHCVLAVGYNDATGRWLCRNSWGPDWGLQGYFTLPYAYLTDPNLASDFWTIRTVK